ncbi:hypothetical protein N0V84_012656 [Fusarium piperis]|uniref:Uncharacterized protein n=1 Tax=Fusarium piperis TaxID=1435070 RepID=A0A9W8TC41_9HYPO|nr:hypothetical protein N0V84_012656 [Fusarium piperis]
MASTITRRTAPQSVAGNSAPNHHHDFLARFTEREAQNRTANRPQPLTVREHRAHREALKKVRFINRRYADETKINVAGIWRKWRDYCDTQGIGDWREALEKRPTREILLDFFLHVCEVSNITSWGTSHEYIRQFQILYSNVRGQYLDRNDSKELYKL